MGNLQCWEVLLIWIIVGQGLTVLSVDAGGELFQRAVKPITTNHR